MVRQVRAAAFPGPSLLDGHFSEDDSSASFADALKAWRGNVKTPPPEEASAPGETGCCPVKLAADLDRQLACDRACLCLQVYTSHYITAF